MSLVSPIINAMKRNHIMPWEYKSEETEHIFRVKEKFPRELHLILSCELRSTNYKSGAWKWIVGKGHFIFAGWKDDRFKKQYV